MYEKSPTELRDRLALAVACLATLEIHDVLHDFRRVPISFGHHVRGFHPGNCGSGSIPFESLLENRFIAAVVALAPAICINSQPVTIRYSHSGRRRRYTPDFKVTLETVPHALELLGFERETFVEVKPLRTALKAEGRLSDKFAAVGCATGARIVLVTDVDVEALVREARHVQH